MPCTCDFWPYYISKGIGQTLFSCKLSPDNLIKLKASLHQSNQNAIYAGVLLSNENAPSMQIEINNVFVYGLGSVPNFLYNE